MLIALTCLASAASLLADETADGLAFFETRIRPVLAAHCYECHSAAADELQGGLRLDTREGTRVGGDSGPAVVPGDVDGGLLLSAIRYEDLEMPPDEPLADDVVADFEHWIRLGAPDAREGPASLPTGDPHSPAAREFWSFQPVAEPDLPAVDVRSWPRTSIDYFVLAQLEARGLGPAPPADRATLVRRVYFDLLGLPPTPEQVRAFERDVAPDAYERLVDRLLASPRYGERWAQHWLDVVRYAETEGFEYDRELPGAWRFRDYVIRSFNDDKPYDQFLREQLAGDEIDPSDQELLTAAGLQRLGAVRRNAGNQEVAGSRNEVLTDRTDIVGAAVLGLTVGCARCHDHKFDPIPQQDYYRLQAYFAASREFNMPLVEDDVRVRWESKTKRIESRIKRLKTQLAKQSGDEAERTRTEIDALEATLPPPLPTICSIRNDVEQATLIHVLRRGEWSNPGKPVGPRPPSVLIPIETPEQPAATPNPRTQLATWLTAASHPLTPRVIVNRLWQFHFGRGIVETANDFGRNGQPPSHPALLDHLAHELVAGGWRWKAIHRRILLSGTYQQASRSSYSTRGREIDPHNTLLWRFPRRRLSAEEIRDAMLAVSGRLNDQAGGPSVIVPVDQELVDQLYKPAQWQVTASTEQHARRSIYLLAKRNLKLPFMEVFDQPALQTSCARREQSTHAPQALELLNGRLSNQLADAFAQRLREDAGDDVPRQVELAYRLTASRAPTPAESQLAHEFLGSAPLREFALAMFNLNAFLYVD